MSTRIETLEKFEIVKGYCGDYESCIKCPYVEECDEMFYRFADDMTFGFVVNKMKKERNGKAIKGQLVFDKPTTMPLKIGYFTRLPEKGLYLIWSDERRLQEIDNEMSALRHTLKKLEDEKKVLES